MGGQDKKKSDGDQTTWKVFTVSALILGAVFAYQVIKGTSPATPPPASPSSVSAPAQAVLSGPVVEKRGKSKSGHQLPPDFRLPEIFSGKEIKLSAYAGKVVLLDFWATWCGPCRMELPHFVELHDAYKSKGFSMIGVSLDQQGPDVVRNFASQWKISYPIVVDSSGEVNMAYGGIRSIPMTLLIGKDGSVLESFIGYRPKEVFEEAIKKALKQS
jgi:thiol-disulfide isomerase/thioredoxin